MRRVLVLGLCLALAGCGDDEVADEPRPELEPIAFSDLSGWEEDDPSGALRAFRRSCEKLSAKPADAPIGRPDYAGTAAEWRPACDAALRTELEADAARAFFETRFAAFRLSDGGEEEGLFTGYYEPVLNGAREPDARYATPIRARPEGFARVDLGAFSDDLTGRAIVGRWDGSTLRPLPDREAIDGGALDAVAEPLFWVDDKIDKFFLQIQGSGVIAFENGERARVGYDEQNGKAYRAIGRDLIEMGEISREEVSLQTIRAWLDENPERADALMWRNPSYIFFREATELDPDQGPLGAQNVPLETGRSIAVDPRFTPYGAPIWLETTAPTPEGEVPLRRLLIAQDTGGAIKGVVRGDVYWGGGELAEFIAGHMKSPGSMAILLPRQRAPSS